MKTIISCLLIAVSSFSFAQDNGAIDSKQVNAHLGKIGLGMIYKNGRPVLQSPRECTLLRTEFATESTERDVLVIGYSGRRLNSNDIGVVAQGHRVLGKLFWEAGVFYDAYSKEERFVLSNGVRYEVCQHPATRGSLTSCKDRALAPWTSIEVTNLGVVLNSKFRNPNGQLQSYTSTCRIP